MRYLMSALILSCSLLTATYAPAAVEKTAYSEQTEVAVFIDKMAQKPSFKREALIALFNQVKMQPRIIELMDRPYEAQPWPVYRQTFVSSQRINKGVEFWKQHHETLTRAEKKYGVPASLIVAIIGVESSYGQILGHYRVIDALSTLAFHYPRRAAYFQRELEEFLLLTQELDLDPLSIKGSYAGAIGLGQFMPSSYRKFAVDFSGNGEVDLRYNIVDAIGSIANYFKAHGWRTGEPVVKALDSDDIKVDDKHILLTLQGGISPEYWLGLPNFRVIMRYNLNRQYALAAYQLSEKLAEQYELSA